MVKYSKLHNVTCHERPEEQRYSSTLSLTSALYGSGWLTPRLSRFTPGMTRYFIIQEVVWAPGPSWTGAENVTPTGIRTPDPPARSKSLYRLSYRGPLMYMCVYKLWINAFRYCANSLPTCWSSVGPVPDWPPCPWGASHLKRWVKVSIQVYTLPIKLKGLLF